MRPKMTLLKRTSIYRGKIIHLIREELQVNHRRLVRETIQHPGAVVIVPLIDRSHIVFVRQYRRAIDRTILELPAGTLGPGEAPRACAQRELEEETGWHATHLQQLGKFFAAPGCLSEQMTIFLAQELTKVPARPEPDEFLTPVILSLNSAREKIASGAICDAKTIIGVLFLERQGLRTS